MNTTVSYTFINTKTKSLRSYYCNSSDYAFCRLVEEVGEQDLDNWEFLQGII